MSFVRILSTPCKLDRLRVFLNSIQPWYSHRHSCIISTNFIILHFSSFRLKEFHLMKCKYQVWALKFRINTATATINAWICFWNLHQFNRTMFCRCRTASFYNSNAFVSLGCFEFISSTCTPSINLRVEIIWIQSLFKFIWTTKILLYNLYMNSMSIVVTRA